MPLASAPLVLLALQSVTTMEQIGSGQTAAPADTAEMAVEPPDNVTAPDESGETDARTQVYDQLSAGSGRDTRSSQLTKASPNGLVSQLSSGDRNMESAPTLSERQQGFDTATVKLEGTDRCSAELMSASDRELCQRVIENRSAEFAGPEPAKLSPEQKLLGERDFDLVPHGPDGAARRLAKSQNAAGDPEDQAIASVVLNSRPADSEQPAPGDEASDIGSETQALIDAIVSTVAGPRN